ncbi:hypothetical protein DFH29DRAFT_881548 [Suillus ampliporus]|nr:hypothetical protein DFH29DRAFT_881548 [Suillus ampliporus]
MRLFACFLVCAALTTSVLSNNEDSGSELNPSQVVANLSYPSVLSSEKWYTACRCAKKLVRQYLETEAEVDRKYYTLEGSLFIADNCSFEVAPESYTCYDELFNETNYSSTTSAQHWKALVQCNQFAFGASLWCYVLLRVDRINAQSRTYGDFVRLTAYKSLNEFLPAQPKAKETPLSVVAIRFLDHLLAKALTRPRGAKNLKLERRRLALESTVKPICAQAGKYNCVKNVETRYYFGVVRGQQLGVCVYGNQNVNDSIQCEKCGKWGNIMKT